MMNVRVIALAGCALVGALAFGVVGCKGSGTTRTEETNRAGSDFADPEPIGPGSMRHEVDEAVKRYTNSQLSNYAHPHVSYDGKYLAYSATTTGPNPQVFVQEKDKASTRQLTSGPSTSIHPAISYDSKRVAFACNRDGGRFRIYVVDISGVGDWEEIGDANADNTSPSWSPDGQRLVYQTRRNSNEPSSIVIHDRRNGTKTTLCRGMLPEWSPDGSSIVFQRTSRNHPGYASLHTIRPDGSNELMVYNSDTHGITTPCWAGPNWIAFATVNKSHASNNRPGDAFYNADDIWIVHKDGSQARLVTSHRMADWDPAYDPQKSEIIFVSNRSGAQNIYGIQSNISSGMERSNALFSASGR